MNLNDFLNHFENVKKVSNGYDAKCPICNDKKHLHIDFDELNKKTLIHCHKGCSFDEILTAKGLNTSDLYDNDFKNSNYNENSLNKNEKQFNIDFIKTKFKPNNDKNFTFSRMHTYTDEKQKIEFIKVIYKFEKDKKCYWFTKLNNGNYVIGEKGTKPTLYNFEQIKNTTENTIYIVEGEKDVETLKKLNLVATTSPNGANATWDKSYNTYFKNKDIIIIHDNDTAGKQYAEKIHKELINIAKSIVVVNPISILNDIKIKDDITDIFERLGTNETLKRINNVVKESNAIDKQNQSEKEQNKKITLTIETLEKFLDDLDIKIKTNDITHKIIFDGNGLKDFFCENLEENFTGIIHSKMQKKFSNCNFATLQSYLKIIADNNHFNPIIEFLNKYTYDGKDYLNELYSILNIEENDELSKILIKKWLMQCLSLLENSIHNSFGADGVLVLQGKQGIGKTSFFRIISMSEYSVNNEGFFDEGKRIDTQNKDSLIECTSKWIIELGEIESTLKMHNGKEIESLRAFITRRTDTYRKPYGRTQTEVARKTSFCGSCNSFDYLVDQEGNRRFWTIPVKEINLNKLNEFNVIQLWKQIQSLQKNVVVDFRLTKDELQKLTERNSMHTEYKIGEQEILDVFAKFQRKLKPNVTLKDISINMTVSEFINANSELNKIPLAWVGRSLTKLGYEQNASRLRFLPCWSQGLKLNAFIEK